MFDYDDCLTTFKESYDFRYLLDVLKSYRSDLSVTSKLESIYDSDNDYIEQYSFYDHEFVFCIQFTNTLNIYVGCIDYLTNHYGYCQENSLSLDTNLYDLAVSIFDDFYNYSDEETFNEYMSSHISDIMILAS